MSTETLRIDSDAPVRIDTEQTIRIDMDIEDVTPTRRAARFTSPTDGRMPMIWKGIGQ